MVRRALLEREKELTRLSDELAEQRQTLPRVRIDEPYTFATDRDEDAGRTVHGPNTPAGCSGCTFAADSFDGSVAHLNAHDVTFVMASRSPLETLSAYQRRMGWSMPWVSSGGTDINRDFTAGPKRTAATARAGTSGRPAARSLPEQRLRRRAPFSPRAGRPSPRSVTRR